LDTLTSAKYSFKFPIPNCWWDIPWTSLNIYIYIYTLNMYIMYIVEYTYLTYRYRHIWWNWGLNSGLHTCKAGCL
jgi:hypothetical protein